MKTKIILLSITLNLVGYFTIAQQLVKDIKVGSQSSYPSELVDINGTLFFTATTQANGYELWKSDGTAIGTVMVKDIYSGSSSSNISELTNVNGVLFFKAENGINGVELWKSDGTSAGTVMIKDIYSGSIGSTPYHLCNVNGILFFSAGDNLTGSELWKSDGTAAGTIMVKDIYSGFSQSYPEHLININGILFFIAGDVNGKDLWKSDGTSVGTVMVKDICNTTTRPMSCCPLLTNVNGILFFIPINNSANSTGSELWQSDGTNTGTLFVKNIRVGEGGANTYVTAYNGELYFNATNGTNGVELWKSNGTSVGTIMVKDINPNTASSSPNGLMNYNNELFFSANNGTEGVELWKSNGTSIGTVMVKDIFSGVGSAGAGLFFEFNGFLYFKANDGNGTKTWKTDGTTNGTTMHPNDDLNYSLKDYLNAPTSAVVNNTWFFRSSNGGFGEELWKYDGSIIGVNELNRNKISLNVYPNPTNGIINIELDDSKESLVTVYNITGQSILSKTINDKTTTINLNNISNGVYYLQVKNINGVTAKKIILNK